MRIGIDLDNTITYCPEFFSAMTKALKPITEIHIITNRDPSPAEEKATRQELLDLGIYFDRLVLTADKAKYILEAAISIYFDDTDEYFLELPESVTVLKIREPGNFDFGAQRWVYGPGTGRSL